MTCICAATSASTLSMSQQGLLYNREMYIASTFLLFLRNACFGAASMLYLKYKKEQPPTRWVDLIIGIENPPATGQSLGWVFLCLNALMTNQINECQQCQYEHSKRHKVFEVKQILVFLLFLVHKHHPHSM